MQTELVLDLSFKTMVDTWGVSGTPEGLGGTPGGLGGVVSNPISETKMF